MNSKKLKLASEILALADCQYKFWASKKFHCFILWFISYFERNFLIKIKFYFANKILSDTYWIECEFAKESNKKIFEPMTNLRKNKIKSSHPKKIIAQISPLFIKNPYIPQFAALNTPPPKISMIWTFSGYSVFPDLQKIKTSNIFFSKKFFARACKKNQAPWNLGVVPFVSNPKNNL